MTLEEFNHLPSGEVKETLTNCCGSTNWVEKMISRMPFASLEELIYTAEAVWKECNERDALEAFTHHPKIGDLKSLEKKFASTSQFAGNEQKSVESASSGVLIKLAELNDAYEKRFGFIFIVCATGKSAQEMLDLLEGRINNERQEEIQIAKIEQGKITQLRLNKIFA